MKPAEGTSRADWRDEAIDLGVKNDEPDDFKFWGELNAKRAVIDSFRYHQPSPDQILRITTVREGFIDLAKRVMRNSPRSADQTAALRQLHEAMMTTNKSIVTEVKNG